MLFEKIFRESKIILTEGAIVERLKSEFGLRMDHAINHAGLIYTHPESLEFLYRQYIDTAQKFNLPIMLMTPTRRVNAETVIKSGLHHKNLIHDSCEFLNGIKNSYNNFSDHILTGGLLGCKGDAYSGKKMMGIEESYAFHRQQAVKFKREKIDFLFAGIMPEINETIGMASALAETGIPYIISFMIRKDGALLDGTTLTGAIKMIDAQTEPKPHCYMTNCIHPSNVIAALTYIKNKGKPEMKRFCGIQANASTLSPEELNNCNHLRQGDYGLMVREMLLLQSAFDFKIFGGCCGTNEEFIEMLAENLAPSEI